MPRLAIAKRIGGLRPVQVVDSLTSERFRHAARMSLKPGLFTQCWWKYPNVGGPLQPDRPSDILVIPDHFLQGICT